MLLNAADKTTLNLRKILRICFFVDSLPVCIWAETKSHPG